MEEKPAVSADKERKMEIKQICTAAFLFANEWKDWRRRQISLPLTAAYAVAGIVFSIAGHREIQDFLIPAGTGMMFLAVGILTGGALGMGDGWILLALAMLLSTGEYLQMLCLGMVLAAAWSGFLMFICKKSRKTEIPLVPFLFFGYLGGILW